MITLPKEIKSIEEYVLHVIDPVIIEHVVNEIAVETTKVLEAVEATKEKTIMAFTIRSIGHGLAIGLHDFYVGIKAVEGFIAKNNTPQNQAIVEGLTSLIPVFGPEAQTVERALFAIAGQTASILTNVSAGGERKLLDAGFDAAVIADFKALIEAVPGLVKGTATTLPVVTSTVGVPSV